MSKLVLFIDAKLVKQEVVKMYKTGWKMGQGNPKSWPQTVRMDLI